MRFDLISEVYKWKIQMQALSNSFLLQGLFAAANIFSSLKLVYIFSVNPHLGPLQVASNQNWTYLDDEESPE